MAQGKYYSALKTLQEIEHGHLPGVIQFKFAEVIKNSFPKLRQVALLVQPLFQSCFKGGPFYFVERAKRLPRDRSSQRPESGDGYFAKVLAKTKT